MEHCTDLQRCVFRPDFFLITSSFRGLIHYFVFLFFFTSSCFFSLCSCSILAKFLNPKGGFKSEDSGKFLRLQHKATFRTSLLVRTAYATKEVHAWQCFALASFFTYYCIQIYICNLVHRTRAIKTRS